MPTLLKYLSWLSWLKLSEVILFRKNIFITMCAPFLQLFTFLFFGRFFCPSACLLKSNLFAECHLSFRKTTTAEKWISTKIVWPVVWKSYSFFKCLVKDINISDDIITNWLKLSACFLCPMIWTKHEHCHCRKSFSEGPWSSDLNGWSGSMRTRVQS